MTDSHRSIHAASRERAVLFVAWPQFDEAENAWWQRLHGALADHGLRLVLASPSVPPAGLDVAHILVPPLDTFWPRHRTEPPIAPTAFGLDVDVLLAREKTWGSPALFPAFEDYRRRAIEALVGHWFRTVIALEPAAVIIWNGHHVSELILDAVSRQRGIPVMYVERAPMPQALFADERGISAASAVARRASWQVADPDWHASAASVIRGLASGAQTWWEQPVSRDVDRNALRRQLDIPQHARVVLFAGQIDEDTQRFLFSPLFESNASAFAWVLDHLRGRDDVFVLGKQHPRSRTGSEVYRRALQASGVSGAWRSDVSITDALTVADRVVAVNSTVLYEALARGIPVLSLGQWLLSGRGVAHEVQDLAAAGQAVDAWLAGDDVEAHQGAWRESLAFLLSTCLYSYAADAHDRGLLGADDLAGRIRMNADRAVARSCPAFEARYAAYMLTTPSWYVPGGERSEDFDRWVRVTRLRAQVLAGADAVYRGQRLVIWGAGAAGRLVAHLLTRLGVTIAAFVSSAPAPDRPQVDGRPVIAPSELGLRPRDLVLVASTAAHEIAPRLIARGFVDGTDFHVLDCNLLAEIAR